MNSSSSPHYYLACDLGAESGRVMLGSLENGRLKLEEIHRFPSAVLQQPDSLRWDTEVIFESLLTGVKMALEKYPQIESLSVDSWGVDYVLLDADGRKIAEPHHYRDSRTDAIFSALRERLGDAAIFAETGIQFMPFNTLFQLAAEQKTNPAGIAAAKSFLTMGDYFNHLFGGEVAIDESLASTTQLFNPVTMEWSARLIADAGLPVGIFPKIVPPGSVLGSIRPEYSETPVKIIATCSHDTGAAIAAVPAGEGKNWAYLSSGTWSLLGVELDAPLINPEVLAHSFTNEAGFGGTTRFLKNIVGLWILQECRRSWAAENHDYSYAWLMEQAAAAPPLRSLISPSDKRFGKPGGMPEKIVAFCTETGQPVPTSPGQFTRCILESLALLYRKTIQEIEHLTGRELSFIHIVGGGSQSALLNQFCADATGRTVIAGPVEATATGNILVQAIALGHLDFLDAARKVVADSFSVITHQPQPSPAWADADKKINHL